MDDASDLLAFIAAAPSPYHAVDAMRTRLTTAGFSVVTEHDPWDLSAGDRIVVTRDDGSIVAVRIGRRGPADAGFRIVGAHTDSPTLKVRPREDVRRHGASQVGVEPYGGVLAHTWLDRDLGLAGRVAVRDGARVSTRLVHLDRPLLRIPSLAIHLAREIREQGLRLDPQRHLIPMGGGADAPTLRAIVAADVGCDADALVGHDLVTVDTQPPATGGTDGTMLTAPRLDNLWSCHAAVRALCGAGDTDATLVVVANDHEEVGSRTAEGALGSFLHDVLARVVALLDGPGPEPLGRALARSALASADAAHAVHPNYADRHEPAHRPVLGGGPVLKVNAGQSYASDAGSIGAFTARAADAGVALQHFVSRADLPCGSTIGPLTAARLGVQTVDVGPPVLSMHSCREQGHLGDVGPFATALRAHLVA